MELSAGTRLGPCEIVDYIGAGAMGVVYKARDTRLGRDVVIKVLPPMFALFSNSDWSEETGQVILSLTDIESTERKWAHDVAVPGQEYLVSLLNEYRAAWALVRQWTGSDPAIAQREAEIHKLKA